MSQNITTEQRNTLNQALNRAITALRPLLVAKLQAKAGQHWPDVLKASLSQAQQANWTRDLADGKKPEQLIDFHHLRGVVLQNKDLFADLGKSANNLPTWFSELAQIRHEWAHHDDIDPITYDAALSRLILLMRTLGLTEMETELTALKETSSAKTPPAAEPPPAFAAPAGRGDAPQPAFTGQPIPWYRVVLPHEDIRQGHLDESVFAANVADVARKQGPDVYLDPEVFFAKTFFTAGLRTIAQRVVSGLNGGAGSENRVLSLQTGFGGGKTHALISLYHLARLGREAPDVLPLGSLAVTPTFDAARVAVFTNETLDAAQGRVTPEGLHVRTLWGELAYQLGGPAAYERVRKNDEERTAPSGLFRGILAEAQPALLLIDELADYCLRAAGQKVGGTTLADQTISFVQELTQAVTATDGTVLVVTLPASRTEMGNSDQAANVLVALQNRVARVGKDTEPVSGEEIFEVIRRRLFEDLGDEATRQATLDAYANLYRNRRGELPDGVTRAEYRQRMAKAYPFHPELIDIFRERWASDHNFQRTRGALRLLGAVVADLFQRQHSLPGPNLLIHPSDVNLQRVEAIRSEIKRLNGNGYDAVMDADVAGANANAARLDQETPDFRPVGLAQGLTTTILMGTFGGTATRRGFDLKDLKLAFLKPDGFNHNTINTALDKLEDHAHYLYYDSSDPKRYWFETKPNVNILIAQAKNQVQKADIEAEILRRLRTKQNALPGFLVLVDPDPDNVPEQTTLTLVLLRPSRMATAHGVSGETQQWIEKLATKRGSQDRTYRNTLLFGVPLEATSAQLAGAACEYLACLRIREEYGRQLDAEQSKDLKGKIEEANGKVEAALAQSYSLLVKRGGSGPLNTLLIDNTKDTLEAQFNTSGVQRLKDESWLLENLGMLALKNYGLEPTPDRPVKVREVYEAFLRYDDKPMISRPEVVQTSLLRLCQDGALAIASGDGKDFTAIYHRQPVDYFDVKADTYWLLDKSAYQPPQPAPSNPGQPPAPVPAPTPTPNPDGNGQPRRYKAVRVAGKLDRVQWSQAFSSFINPFRNHAIEIEVTIKIHSSAAEPFAENDPKYKLVQESARQMNLGFAEEGEA